MAIAWPLVVSGVLLPAVVFAWAYPSLVHRFSRGLVSSYSKADTARRLRAAAIDGAVAATLAVCAWPMESTLLCVLSAGYLLMRDAIAGQSIGKLVLGLVVMDLQSGRPTSLLGSVKRNVILLLPGANVAAVFLEGRTILADPQGQRLGDRLAQTQVVEGARAGDLVRWVQDWLLHAGGVIGRAAGQRRREPGRFDRAA